MGRRRQLQTELTNLLPNAHIYFDPPEKCKMIFPCVRYKYSTGETKFAGDKPFNFRNRYELVYITNDASDATHEIIAMHFPLCTLSRVYTQDGLRHFLFNLYY